MNPQVAKYRSLPFAVALFASLLPFATMTSVSTGGFTAIQLALGTWLEGQTPRSEWHAVLALVLTAVGLMLSFRPAVTLVLRAELGCSAAALLLLLALQSKMLRIANAYGVQVSFDVGYWLAVLALVAAVVLSVMLLRSKHPQAAAPPS